LSATIDIQAVQSVEHPERGIARTVRDLVDAIERGQPDHVGAYVYNPTLPIPRSMASLARAGRLLASTDLRRGQASVHLVASPFEGSSFDQLVPTATRLDGAALAVMLYDLIPLRFPDHYLSHPMARRRYTARLELVRSADVVLAISEQTARDAVDLLGLSARRVEVVGCAPSEHFLPPDDPGAAQRHRRERFPELATRFVLCPGGDDWRKNLGGLVDAWLELDGLGPDGPVDLVISGNLRDQHESLRHRARRAGHSAQLHLPGRLADADLLTLYQTADLVVFPSRFEGYGLPVMEARRAGAAVIASRNSSLVELLPDDALFDLDRPDDLVARMGTALRDPEHLDALRRAAVPDGHTWTEVADRVVDALDRVGTVRARRPRRRRRAQIAVVTPLPPTPSGVADHSQRLLEALQVHADVHAFTDDLDLVRPPEGVGLHRLAHLDRASAGRGEFDAVLHCWGNSEHHAAMLPAMRAWPGIVLAHDVAVAGLYDWCSRFEPDLVEGATFGQLLRRAYGDRLPAVLRGVEPLTYVEADAAGLTMAGDVLAWSERFLVHSHAARDLAAGDEPRWADRIEVVPFAFPPPRLRRRPHQTGSPPIVATFGIVRHTKQVDLVLDVLALVADRHPDVRLAYVGDIGHGLRDALQRRAERLGLADRVVFTGRVPRETYEHWLSVADVAIQLRRSWGGEASAAIADALAWGIPTVVSDIGWARELPADTVSRVAGDAASVEIADAVSTLLIDGELRAHRSRAAVDHAAANGFAPLAAHLLALVTDPSRSPADFDA
jgi:glycosyltransferase involved in cell wall biosynthesis